jgi:hypothetical protein
MPSVVTASRSASESVGGADVATGAAINIDTAVSNAARQASLLTGTSPIYRAATLL